MRRLIKLAMPFIVNDDSVPSHFTCAIEDLQEKLGFSRKDNLVRLLKSQYVYGVDYTTRIADERKTAGRPPHAYFVNEKTFKLLAARCGTRKMGRKPTVLLGDFQLTHIKRFLPKEEEIIGFLLSVYGHHFTCISQWNFATYRADLYVEEKHLVIECDEHGHSSYDESREAARCKALHDLDVLVYRFNPDTPNFTLAKVMQDVNKILFDL